MQGTLKGVLKIKFSQAHQFWCNIPWRAPLQINQISSAPAAIYEMRKQDAREMMAMSGFDGSVRTRATSGQRDRKQSPLLASQYVLHNAMK